MDCKSLTNDVLIDHSEGQGESAGRLSIDEHLRECGACKARAYEVERIGATIRTMLTTPPQKALLDQLDAGVLGSLDTRPSAQSPDSRARFAWRIGIVATAAAAAVLAAVLTFDLWPRRMGTEAGRPEVRHVPPPPTSRNAAPSPSRAVPPPAPEEPPSPPPPVEPERAPEKPVVREPAAAPPPPPPESSPPTRMPATEPPNTEPKRNPKPPPAPAPAPEPAFAKGDLNGDRVVDGRDVDYLDAAIREGRTPDLGRADVTGDGRVDCGDVFALLQALERNP